MILLLLAACGGDSADNAPVTLPVAAEKATFATVASLGSYHLQASVRRTVAAPGAEPQAAAETVEIRWKDQDHWSYVLGRDGRVRTEVVVWDGVAWAGTGDGPPARKGDAEPYRVQLASVWDPWRWGLESLASDLVLEPGEIELLEGRRVRRHTLGLPPVPAPDPTTAEPAPPPKPRRGWTPTAASGELWIDEETALRLKGQVSVEASSGARAQHLQLLFAIDGIGVDPGVSPPGGDKP